VDNAVNIQGSKRDAEEANPVETLGEEHGTAFRSIVKREAPEKDSEEGVHQGRFMGFGAAEGNETKPGLLGGVLGGI
jgi:hypothetical protein